MKGKKILEDVLIEITSTRGLVWVSALITLGILSFYFGFGAGFDKGQVSKVEDDYLSLYRKLYSNSSFPNLNTLEFEDNFNYDELLKAIVAVNDKSVTHEDYARFSAVVDEMNRALLKHTSDKLQLNTSDHLKVVKEYENLHPDLAKQYYSELKDFNKKSKKLNDTTYIIRRNYQGANTFSKVLSSHACDVVSLVFGAAALNATKAAALSMLNSEPCEGIIEEFTYPVVLKLMETGAVKDLRISKLKIKKHIRDQIVELATAEDKVEVQVEERFKKIVADGALWGLFNSNADVELRVPGTIKAGFKLDEFFSLEIDYQKEVIYVVLPEPKILSVQADPQFTEIDNGYLNKVGMEEINIVLESAKSKMRQHVDQTGIFEDAKQNARGIVEILFQPILIASNLDYKIDVKFKKEFEFSSNARPKDLQIK